MKNVRLTGLTARKFGIEIELFATRTNTSGADAIVNALTAAGIECRYAGYTHARTTYWKVVTDGSVNTPDGRGGLELVSPPLSGEEGLKEIEKVCEALATIGSWVNRTCGFHVHHDASDLSFEAVVGCAKLVRRFQPVIDGLMPESRRGSAARYCSPWSESQINTLVARGSLAGIRSMFHGDSSDRYRTFNVCSLARHGTVEFRQHNGTVEARKMIPWIVLTQGLVEKAKSGVRVKSGQIVANGDGLDLLFRNAGLRTCLPWGQKLNPEHETRARQATEWFSARASEFGLVELTNNAAARSRARRAASAAERVAAAVAMAVSVASMADATPATDGPVSQ